VRPPGTALAQAEMIEALRVIVPRVDLEPTRRDPDPVVLKGVTLAPKHGVRVRVRDVRPPALSGEFDRDPLEQVEGVL
jgi:cytochrome P450